jgi:hypothetical protein
VDEEVRGDGDAPLRLRGKVCTPVKPGQSLGSETRVRQEGPGDGGCVELLYAIQDVYLCEEVTVA